ncbi:hypothetical protein ABPG77_010380, partial [Micractinium sp. CCAP 211/92]
MQQARVAAAALLAVLFSQLAHSRLACLGSSTRCMQEPGAGAAQQQSSKEPHPPSRRMLINFGQDAPAN